MRMVLKVPKVGDPADKVRMLEVMAKTGNLLAEGIY